MSWQILNGDCVERMREMDEASVDAIVTDPPYGLEFMGKEWDRFAPQGTTAKVQRSKPGGLGERSWTVSGTKGVRSTFKCRRCGGWSGTFSDARRKRQRPCECEQPDFDYAGAPPALLAFQAWSTEWATEALRVLKPGGHLLAFGGTRTYHRLACAVEDAGFEIRDSVIWLYGSGFPKSLSVSKAIDKAERGVPQGTEDPTSPNHGRYKSGCSEENPSGRGFGAGPGAFMKDATPPAIASEKTVLPNDAEAADVSQKNTLDATANSCPYREDSAQCGLWAGHSGAHFMQKVAGTQWEGWGTALKPAHEPIVVARKPLTGTVAANCLEWGTGALNVDATRIGASNTPACRDGDSSGGNSPSRESSLSLHTLRSLLVAASEQLPEPHSRLVASDLAHAVGARPVPDSQDGCLTCSRCGDALVRLGKAVAQEAAPSPLDAHSVLSRRWLVGRIRELQCDDHPSTWDVLARIAASDIGYSNGRTGEASAGKRYTDEGSTNFAPIPGPRGGDSLGRWPTNVVLSHLPECEQVGTRRVKPPNGSGRASKKSSGQMLPLRESPTDYQSEGGGFVDEDGTEQIAAWRCVEGCPVAALDEQSGELAKQGSPKIKDTGDSALFGGGSPDGYFGDSGAASRFFYTAKASRAERNAGLDGFEERESRRYGDRDAGALPQQTPQGAIRMQNVHPTVKPIDLMRWLVRLVTPPGGTVLDPFTGSGTTGIAAVLEGFDFIGIEREAEYVEIARARIAWWEQHQGREADEVLAESRRSEAIREQHEAAGQMGLEL